MTTEIKHLEVPKESITALYRRDTPRPSDADYIRPIAGPVVVAKLLKSADRIDELFPEGHPWRDGARYAAAELRHEAMELEAEIK